MLSPQEKVYEGLLTGKGPELEVVEMGETGRGVVAREKIAKQSFVCEYKASVVERDERGKREFRHHYNTMGCYMVDVAHSVGKGKVTLDATDQLHNYGRYINHAINANIRPWRLIHVRGKLRMGFMSIRDIEDGEELAWDYGVRDKEIPFLSKGRLEEGRVVGGVSEELNEEVVVTKKDPPRRRYVFCPVKGCGSPPLQKMPQHLRQYHKLSEAEITKSSKKKQYATLKEVRDWKG